MGYEKQSKLHIVAVVAVIPNNEGKFLVLKRRGDEIAYPGMYTFPGGKIEDNDTVAETLQKEVMEEAGLTLKPGQILLKDKSIIRPDGQTAKFFSYLCQATNTNKVIVSADFTDYKWVSAAELKELWHVGIEEDLKKAEQLLNAKVDIALLSTQSVKEDLQP